MQQFTASKSGRLTIHEMGSGPIDFIWAHGWGQNHAAFMSLAAAFSGQGRHLMLDFPGFGDSPPPPEPWGTAEYANLVHEWLGQFPKRRRIWIGHSFGCRIGIRLASAYPDCVDGLFLISAAGLRARTTLRAKIMRFWRTRTFKVLQIVARSEVARDRLRERWGSLDYRRAGPLRRTLVKVVNEDLTSQSRRIQVPVQLVYGINDTETPPTMGQKFEALIPGSHLTILPKYGHLDILSSGKFQIQALLKEFIGNVCK